jgi:SP family myo-inositol transporter-like MFS transporter 13
LTTPIYIAEVALPSMRGRLVTVNAFLVTVGQFTAGMMDGMFDEFAPQGGWRFMLGLAAIPSIVMYLGFLQLPESPRWLAMQGKTEEAREVLETMRESPAIVALELAEILESIPKSRRRDQSTTETESEPSSDPTSDPTSDALQEEGLEEVEFNVDDDGFVDQFREMMADKPTRRALVLGCGLMFIQQFSGINT